MEQEGMVMGVASSERFPSNNQIPLVVAEGRGAVLNHLHRLLASEIICFLKQETMSLFYATLRTTLNACGEEGAQ